MEIDEIIERQSQREISDALFKRQVEALERIANSLEKIATAIQPGKDGFPCIQVTDTYQEWRNNSIRSITRCPHHSISIFIT